MDRDKDGWIEKQTESEIQKNGERDRQKERRIE